MNFSSPFVIIFLAGTILNFLLDNFLEFIDFKNRKNNGQKIPQELEGSVKPETLAKTCLYEDAQYKLWIPENILRTLLSLVLICSGFYFWLLNFINSSITQNSFLILMLFTIFASIPGRKYTSAFNSSSNNKLSFCSSLNFFKFLSITCPFRPFSGAM